MTTPVRIQRKRTKGYDMQAESRAINGLECVYVGRGTPYGNPFKVGDTVIVKSEAGEDYVVVTTEIAVLLFRHRMNNIVEQLGLFPFEALKGRNVSCFCALDAPCHGDVLLELVNTEPPQRGE